MRRLFGFLALASVFVLPWMSAGEQAAEAGGYYGGYSYYRPTYYPSYGYQQSYYTPSYNYFNYYPTLPTYSYYTPQYFYQTTNYYDGGYHYHNAGYFNGQYFPAGNYRWYNGSWQAQQAYSNGRGDWKSQLLELAQARDQVEGEIRKNAADSLAFNQAISALGLTGNFRLEGYGQSYGFAPHYVNQNANLGTYGANGSTLYGYTLNSIKDVYGSSDVNVLFQQAQRLAQNAQSLGGQATQEFQAAITQEGNNRSRVAEILAKAQAAAEALKAAEGTGSRTTTSTTTFGVGQEQRTPGQQQSQQGPAISPDFAALATAKCLKCHGPDKKEGKFDVREYTQLSTADKAKVWERIMSPDKTKRMPKDGDPLTPEEKKIFFVN